MKKEFYSERKNGIQKTDWMTFRYAFYKCFHSLAKEGVFRESMSIEKSFTTQKIEQKAVDYFCKKLKVFLVNPTQKSLSKISEDDFFTVIEVCFDAISFPSQGSDAASDVPLRILKKKYLPEINEVLEKSGYFLSEDGEIQREPEDGMKDLVEDCIGDEDIQKRIKHAQNLFLNRESDLEKKRSACETLGHILEEYREDIKKTDLGKESEELFGIINNWGIRHNKKGTKKIEYEELLDWIFYSQLNTLKTYLKLKEKTQE